MGASDGNPSIIAIKLFRFLICCSFLDLTRLGDKKGISCFKVVIRYFNIVTIKPLSSGSHIVVSIGGCCKIRKTPNVFLKIFIFAVSVGSTPYFGFNSTHILPIIFEKSLLINFLDCSCISIYSPAIFNKTGYSPVISTSFSFLGPILLEFTCRLPRLGNLKPWSGIPLERLLELIDRLLGSGIIPILGFDIPMEGEVEVEVEVLIGRLLGLGIRATLGFDIPKVVVGSGFCKIGTTFALLKRAPPSKSI